MARLKDVYKSTVVEGLKQKFNYTNPMSIPRMQKVVVSMGVGKAV
jgi:large subunit ribosomal protein L5